MPACIVFGCSTMSHSKNEDVTLHVFPKSREKIKVWLSNIGVVNELLDIQATIILADDLGDQFVVCSLHFAPDQYELDLLCKTGRLCRTKRLKSDAIPTLFHNVVLMPTVTLNLADPTIANIGHTAAGLQQFNRPAWLQGGKSKHLMMRSAPAPSHYPYDCTLVHERRILSEHGLVQTEHQSFQEMKILVHQCTQTDFSPLKVDQGTDPEYTWTDLMSQMWGLTRPKLFMKDKFIHWPEFEYNFVGQAFKVSMDHNYSQEILKKKVKKVELPKLPKLPKPARLPKLPKPARLPKLPKSARLPKLPKPARLLSLPTPPKTNFEPEPELEPEPIWADFEASDDDAWPLLQENLGKDPDYCPSAEDYSTDTDEENKSSDSYCTTDEECATSLLEEQQGVPAGECLMPAPLLDNDINNAKDENPQHRQHMNQVVPIQESNRLHESLDSSVLKDEVMGIKTEQEEVTDEEYPQISAVVDGGRLLVVGKEIVMKTVGEEVCDAQEDSTVTSGLGGSCGQSLNTEIVMKTVGQFECGTAEDFLLANGLDGISCVRLSSESSSIKPEDETMVEAEKAEEAVGQIAEEVPIDAVVESSSMKPKDETDDETEDSDEGDGHFTGAPVDVGTGYGSAIVKTEAPDVTDLQKVLPIEAERHHKRLFSPSPRDSDTCENLARKSIRYRSSGTKINEILGNLTVSQSCDREEREEILPVAQDLRPPIEATRVGRFFNFESGTPYRCTNCGITFTYYEPRIILRSFRGTEGQPSCPNCGKKCCEKVPQISDQAADVKHTCSQCEEMFQTNEELTKHLATTSHSLFWCAECERGFKNKSGLRRHRYCVHSRTKGVKCKECGKHFASKQSLGVHSRYHKKYSGVKSEKLLQAQTPCKNYYQCSECCQTFSTASRFFIHERCHTGERPFKCKKCRKRFKQKSHLLRHLLIHGIGKPFQCEVCDKGFTKHCYYAKHVELHKETNPSCTVCGETFRTSLCLQRHERDKHSDETVHNCGECGKEFRLMHYFLKHQKTHLKDGAA